MIVFPVRPVTLAVIKYKASVKLDHILVVVPYLARCVLKDPIVLRDLHLQLFARAVSTRILQRLLVLHAML